jgi:hypothetical protein
LQNLHALGVCLRYKDLADFNSLVLNPEWISHGVYKIVNQVHNKGAHSALLTDLSCIFEDEAERYPKDKHRFLFELMKRYELGYETVKKELIIPHLLHDDRPDTLPDFPIEESLMLRYRAEQPLPSNTISRFIVRHNDDIKKEGADYLVWRFGVVLKTGKDTIALVRESTDDRMITVLVKGIEKTAYLDKLRATLNDIFNSYKSNKPELEYIVERSELIPDRIEKKPLWLPEEKIINHVVHNRPYYDDYSNKEILLQPVVVKYNIQVDNVLIGEQSGIMIGGKYNTMTFSDDMREDIEKIIPQITAIAQVLSDEQEEIIDELKRIDTQLGKSQPKETVIRSALQTVHGILCGVTGNAMTSNVLEAIGKLIEKLGG